MHVEVTVDDVVGYIGDRQRAWSCVTISNLIVVWNFLPLPWRFQHANGGLDTR